jgi:hypothetical protein
MRWFELMRFSHDHHAQTHCLDPDGPWSERPRTARKESFKAFFSAPGYGVSIRGPFFRGFGVVTTLGTRINTRFLTSHMQKHPPGFARFPHGFKNTAPRLSSLLPCFISKKEKKRADQEKKRPPGFQKSPRNCQMRTIRKRGEMALFEKNRGDAQMGKVQCFQRCWLFFKALKTVPRVFAGKCHPPGPVLKNGSRYAA